MVAGAAGLGLLSKAAIGNIITSSWFEISLAEWSLNKSLFAKKITNLDFPAITKKDFGISVVEYVNVFFKDHAEDSKYLNQLLHRCKDNGIKNHLIMIDDEGQLGNPNEAERKKLLKIIINGYMPRNILAAQLSV